MPTESLEQFRRRYHLLIGQLYVQSGAQRFGVAPADFGEALYRSYRRRAETGPEFRDASGIEAFLNSLQVCDLALAIGCRQGSEDAWSEFFARYRGVIDSAARALVSDPVRARELADSTYADLYGLREAGGHRASPLDHYHGRSMLAAWLRVVIARRQVDMWRAERPAAPIEKITERITADGAPHSGSPDPEGARYIPMLSDSLERAIAALDTRDRLRLSYYYVHELPLAEIGRLLHEHESTSSRRLAAARARIRALVEHSLRIDHRLSDEQIELCFDCATGDWPFNLAQLLS